MKSSDSGILRIKSCNPSHVDWSWNFSGIPPNLLGRALYVWVNSRGNSGLPVLDLVQDIFSIIYHPIVTGPEINVGLFAPFSEFVLIGSNYCGKLKRIGEKIETSDSLTGRDCQCRVVWNWPYASSHLFARPKILKTILRVVCFGAPICSLAASRPLWPRVGFSGDCGLYRINCKSNWCPWSLMPWSYFTSFRVPDDCRFLL